MSHLCAVIPPHASKSWSSSSLSLPFESPSFPSSSESFAASLTLETIVPESRVAVWKFSIRGHVHMTSAIFSDFLTPLPHSSAFHATYQYCSSAKLAHFWTPLPPSMQTSYVHRPLGNQREVQPENSQQWKRGRLSVLHSALTLTNLA